MIRCSRMLCAVTALILTWAGTARAQQAAAPSASTQPGAELHVYVLTFGPGDDPWEKFGHNAIRVVDDRITGDYHDVVYNWGGFSFDNGFVAFCLQFVQGRLNYWMFADRGPQTLDYYKTALNRSIYQQELALGAEQKARLQEALDWTNTNQHRFYRYDYYRDNCSTRVRDVVDGLTEGRLAARTRSVPSGVTYRWHTRRLTAETPWLYVALQGVLGQPVDQPISQWDEMFLPFALRDRLRELQVPDPDGSGRLVPLVRRDTVIYESTRPASPSRPPATVGWFLLAGIGLSLIYLALGHFVQRKKAARWAFTIVALPWLLLLGLAGPFLVWAWLFTNHVVAARNENILHVSPLMFPMIVLLPMLVFGRRKYAQIAQWLMTTIAGIAVLGLALKVFPAFHQVNGDIIALTLPVNLSLAFIAWMLAGAVKRKDEAKRVNGTPVPASEAREQTKRRRKPASN